MSVDGDGEVDEIGDVSEVDEIADVGELFYFLHDDMR